jgi:hypothetical protein
MRKTLLLVVAALALSGCGKKGSEAKGDCATSVANAVSLSAEEFKKQGVTDATVAKIRDSSITRCKEDKWTNEILKCLADAKKADDVAKCQQMMSKEQSDNMAKAIAGAMGTQPEPPPDTGSGSGSGSGSAPAPSGDIAGLPPECAEYRSFIEKLATCEKMPQASRDALKQSYDAMASGWKDLDKLPPEAKASLVSSCKQGVEVLKKTAGPACGLDKAEGSAK